jgi:hypothetical protein
LQRYNPQTIQGYTALFKMFLDLPRHRLPTVLSEEEVTIIFKPVTNHDYCSTLQYETAPVSCSRELSF